MKNGACYIRVSTDKQDELSPDAQKRLLLDYARENDIIVTEDSIFWEIGISGRKTENRPAFRQMVAAAKSKDHPFDVILVWKFSRFARNQEESIVYKSLLKKSGVDVVSVSEPLPEGIMGGLIERILEWMDEYYSIRLSGEVMRGMTEKAMRGGYQSNPPMGYDRERGGLPVVNEKEAAIVRRVFHLFVNEKMSMCAIAKRMNLDGYPTKRGAHWNVTHIRYMLGNPFYIGKIRWNYITHANGRRKKDEGDWIIVDGVHEPIIPEETFQAAQKRLKGTAGRSWASGHTSSCHWLSGVLKCEVCGGPMTYMGPTNRNGASYRCVNHVRGACSTTGRIALSKLESAVLSGLEDPFSAAADAVFVQRDLRQDDTNAQQIIQDQIKDLGRKEKRLRAAYMDGIDTLEDYRDARRTLDARREELKKRLEELTCPEESEDVRLRLVQNTRDVLKVLKNPDIDVLKKQDAIRNICQKILWNKETSTLTFYFYT